MEWNVYYHDSNAQKIVPWNVFKHGTFKKEVDRLLKEKLTKEEFANKLKTEVAYYFMSKCEYEIVLCPWTGRADDTKIGIYDQITINWDKFVDYVWSFKELIKYE